MVDFKGIIAKIQNIFEATSLYIGLDIGASSLKIVVVKNNSAKKPEVIAVGYEDTPVGCVIDGQLAQPKIIEELIKSVMKKIDVKIRGRPVNVGLRGLSLVLKRVILPFQKPDEMVQQIWVEAQQQVDADLTNWSLSYQMLGKADAEGQVPVMIVAAKRSAVNDVVQLMTDLEMDLHVIDCDIFSVENVVEKIYGVNPAETNIILDIGNDSSQFVLINEGQPVLCRSFAIGGANLTEQISKALNIPLTQAESLKISANSSGELATNPKLERCVQNHASIICDEIKRTLDFFASSQNHVVFDGFQKVFLSGGGSSVLLLVERIARFLRAEAVVVNPFDAMKVPDHIAKSVHGYTHNFSVACGLALRYLGDRPV